MNKAFDVRHPFFRPLWRRIMVTAFCFLWAMIELRSGGPFWAMLFGGCGLYIGYHFFVAFDPTDYERKEGPE